MKATNSLISRYGVAFQHSSSRLYFHGWNHEKIGIFSEISRDILENSRCGYGNGVEVYIFKSNLGSMRMGDACKENVVASRWQLLKEFDSLFSNWDVRWEMEKIKK